MRGGIRCGLGRDRNLPITSCGSTGFPVGNRSAPSPSSEEEGWGEGVGKRWPLGSGGPRTQGSSTPPGDERCRAGALAETLPPHGCPPLPPGSADPLTQPSPPMGARGFKNFAHPYDFRKSLKSWAADGRPSVRTTVPAWSELLLAAILVAPVSGAFWLESRPN